MSSTTNTTCIERALVDAHFEGTISPENERKLREHLTTCASCRGLYRKRQLLSKLDPEALGAEDRLAHGLGFSVTKKKIAPPRVLRFERKLPLVISALALAAVLFLFLRSPKHEDSSDGFTARGSIVSSTATGPKINVYRVPKGGQPTLLVIGEAGGGASIAKSDELAFAYQAPEKETTHLMIFGVDERGRVFWFYPAWSNEAENPTALKIEQDQKPHELREAIRHQLDGERLEIHGLFLNHPLNVRDVETALKKRESDIGPVMMPGASDHVIMLGVGPQ